MERRCLVRPRWFLPSEVVVHNEILDLWVIVNSKVYNLTKLMWENLSNPEILPILAFGGKDISWWFDSDKRFKTFMHPKTGSKEPYMPYGTVLHAYEYCHKKHLDIPEFVPWWRNEEYVIGNVTRNPRPLKILNTLSDITVELSVCEEETILEISQRYKKYNLLCLEYTWYHLDKELDMCATLTQNCIPDQRELFWHLDLPHNFFVPTIHLKYDDKEHKDICGKEKTYHNLATIDCRCLKTNCK